MVHDRRVKNQSLNVCVRVIYDPTFLCLFLFVFDGLNDAQAGDAWRSTVDKTEYYVVPRKLREVAERTGFVCRMEKCSRGKQPQHPH